jgi:hypothetical protein
MYAMAYSIPIKNHISLSDKTATGVAKLAEVFGVSNDECVERLLTRFVFDSLERAGNEIIAEEVEQIVCESRSQAVTMAKRLEDFAGETRKNNAGQRRVRASAVRYGDGWGVKAVVA